MKVVYTYQARQDLMDIYIYIAYSLLVPETGQRITEQIMEQAKSLASMPERNPLYKDDPWHSRGVRFLPVKNYLIFYTIDPAAEIVSISRILYGGRDISRQLEQTKDW